jgi:hypothetical protein
VIYGEQGSAKSSLVRVLRALVDPNTAALRTTPHDERDLVIAATNGWLIALDNLSHLPDWLSDALCRLATCSGFATRELYTDAEEAIFAAQRPIVVNGIEEVATRGDLLDRALIVYLPTIPEEKRQDEKTFWRVFETKQPQLLGALLDVVSAGLRTLPRVQLDHLPRMADFALWACAAADACGWMVADFLDAYQGVQKAAHELTLEASAVAPFVRTLVATTSPWQGTASALLTALEALVPGGMTVQGKLTATASSDITKQKTWPKNGRTLKIPTHSNEEYCMTTVELLQDLHARDIRLTVEGNRLTYDAPEGVVTEEVLTLLRQHKVAILEMWEERAAICEFEGGLPREAAERLAWECLVSRTPDAVTQPRLVENTGDRMTM